VALGCGGRRAVGGPGAPTALEAQYSAVRWAPADASWVVTCARTRDCVTAAHELVELVSIGLGLPSGWLDRALRQRLGGSPLSLDDVAAAGIDLEAGAAVVGQGGFPTFIVPVRDGEALRRSLDSMRPERGAALVQHRGHDVYSWSEGSSQDGAEISWALLDGWFLVRLGTASGPQASLAWLDQVLAAPGGASLAGDPDLAAAARRGGAALSGGGPPGLVARVRFDRLARDLAGEAGVPRPLVTCLERAARIAPQLVGAAQVSWDGAAGWAAIDLPAGAAAELREQVAPAAPPGFLSYRRDAAIAASFALDLGWLERVRRAAGCSLWSEPIRDPIRAITGMAGPRGWHLAATDLDPDRMSGAGAVHLVLADRELVRAQLESIPGRSLFERTRTVAGRQVRVLSLPGLPSIFHHQEGDRFTGALGGEAMAAALGPGDGHGSPPGVHELAALRIEPGRLPNLPQLLRTVLARALGWDSGEAGAQLAARLVRYQSGSLELTLDGDSLALRARMGLRK
jgi:hypothetical protein